MGDDKNRQDVRLVLAVEVLPLRAGHAGPGPARRDARAVFGRALLETWRDALSGGSRPGLETSEANV